MKKSDLVRVIREVIRQEVKKVVKEELKAIAPKKEGNPNEFSSMMEHADELFNGPKTQKQNFTNDPILNDILNETANTTSDWPTMGNKTLTSRDAMVNSLGIGNPDQLFGGNNVKPTAQQMLPNDRKHVEIKPELEKALTRDYSSLMKAIDKKKK